MPVKNNESDDTDEELDLNEKAINELAKPEHCTFKVGRKVYCS